MKQNEYAWIFVPIQKSGMATIDHEQDDIRKKET